MLKLKRVLLDRPGLTRDALQFEAVSTPVVYHATIDRYRRYVAPTFQ